MDKDRDEQLRLEEVWQSQAAVKAPPLDFTSKNYPAAWAAASEEQASPEKVCDLIKTSLGWPSWVRLYNKPIQALTAARELARQQVGTAGVVHVAPGTGSPLQPPKGDPGLAVLRADWAPDKQSLLTDQADIRAARLYLLLDECGTAFRMGPNGAAGFYGLAPDAVLMGPGLAAGLDFAALAGVGQAPPQSRRQPGPEALGAALGILQKVRRPDFAGHVAELGRLFIKGLEFFSQKAMVSDDLKWEGPAAMPRLSGRRLWAFIRLAEEEGLIMKPVIQLDPSMELDEVPTRLWGRLARAAARLRVLPEGDMAPLGWRDAAQSTSCNRAAEILAAIVEK